MSSVIVLDSSDEDEAPAKKPYLPPSIPATITPIKAVAPAVGATNGTTTPLLANALKHKKPKPRTIPSGITITRRSPVTVVASSSSKITTTNSTNASIVAKLVSTVGSGAGVGVSAVRATATAAAVSAARAIAASAVTAVNPSTSYTAAITTTSGNSNSPAALPVVIGNTTVSSPRTGVTNNNVVPAQRGGVTGSSTTASRTMVTATSTSYGLTRASIATTVAASFAKGSVNNAETLLSSFLTTADGNVAMPTLTTLPKINAAFTLGKTNVRQTPTPPRQMVQQQPQQQQQHQLHSHLKQQQQQQQQVLPQLSQLPQLQPSPSVLRKRLTNAAATSPPQLLLQRPPQQQQQTIKYKQQQQVQKPAQVLANKQQQSSLPRQQQQQQPRKLAPKQQQQQFQTAPKQHPPQLQQQQRTLSPATITAISSVTGNTMSGGPTSSVMPLISTVQSMAASATPPLQLLATPPHSAATTFNEQLLFSPELRHAAHSLPLSTTVTPMPPLSELSFNNNNNNNNSTATNNNNFKIQLPTKRSSSNSTGHNTAKTPSPTTSPPSANVTSAAIASTQLQRLSGGAEKIAAISTRASTATMISATNNSKGSSLNTPPPTPITAATATVKRIKPTTIMKSSDEAWQKRARNAAFLNDDVVMVELNSKSASNSPKPIQSPKAIIQSPSPMPTSTAKLKTGVRTTASLKPQTPPLGPKQSFKHSPPPILDLTESPEKLSTRTAISNTSTPTFSVKARKFSSERLNGVASASASPSASDSSKATAEERAPMQPEYEELLKTCRIADPSADMEKLVKSKMVKYYYNVHPDFVRSKGFLKSLRVVTENIRREPELVYVHLKTIVDELKVRMKSKQTAVVEVEAGTEAMAEAEEEAPCSRDNNNITVSKHTDEQIKKLNRALYILTRRIAILEAAEVDWDEEDSNYLKTERFKKRACQIHEKLCDLTGESKNAHRLAKKPIHFSGTVYPQFNKTLGAYVNRTREFPDYYDVLRLLEHCNRQFGYDLAQFELKRIAHDAFMKVGKLLQSRRKTDLYETVTHFTANEKDPAALDPMLQAKLSDNQKKQTRISDVIEKYAREQDMLAEEHREARLARAKSAKGGTSDAEADADDGIDVNDEDADVDDNDDDDDKTHVKATTKAKVEKKAVPKKLNGKATRNTTDTKVRNIESAEEDNDDVEEENDDEDDENDNENASDLEADVEKLANGYLSDVESDVEIVFNISDDALIVTDVKQPKDKIQHQKQKDDTDSLGVVASTSAAAAAAATTTKSNKDKCTKSIGAVSACDKSVKPTAASTVPLANRTAKVNNETVKTKNTASEHNNNVTREKTVDPLALEPPLADGKKATPAHIPNGRMKLTDSGGGGNTGNGTKSSSTTSATISATGAQPIIKIVSVSSLNEMVCIEGDPHKSSRSAKANTVNDDQNRGNITTTVAAAKSSNKTTSKPNALTNASQNQQTVDEIVISDEES